MNINGLIKGLHHVTATVNGAQEDYNFYVKLLGQRLVKETVNFDNERVYHFYYGNEIGLPSTIFTTFPYRGEGVRKGIIGTGQVYETVFSAPADSLPFWENRLVSFGINVETSIRFNQKILQFKDPSGLLISIIEDSSDKREPVWSTDDIIRKNALPGINHVTLAVAEPKETITFLTEFGYSISKSDRKYTLLEAGNGGAGNSLVVMDGKELPRGINGLGTVHHVAHRVASIEDTIRLKPILENRFGLKVTEIKDRKYFKSIYFRIPGGVLFEVATEGPGFLVDETNEELGTSLKLPDWQEPNRSQIENNLNPYKK